MDQGDGLRHGWSCHEQTTLLSGIKEAEYFQVYPCIHWTGLLDWNTGPDYWTQIFLKLVYKISIFHKYHKNMEHKQATDLHMKVDFITIRFMP